MAQLVSRGLKEISSPHKLGLSPVIALLSLAFWAWPWGIVGMILAVPLTVIGKIILDNIRETRSLETLLSNE